MRAEHLEALVEEPAMEVFLRGLLPRLLGPETTFDVHPFQGKQDLMGQLPDRLRGYSRWLPDGWRIIVIVDRDEDDCHKLKKQLDLMASAAGLSTRSTATSGRWKVVNRLAIEELEAWYFGDWEAVRQAYPRVSRTIPQQASYRRPDAIAGGTWEALERVLQRAGYFKSGLRKVELARHLGKQVDPDRNRSHSFRKLRDVVLDAVA